MLDKFIQIVEENDLKPEDIEKVVYTPHPILQFKLWQENKLRTEEDYSFHAPYLLSCAAHRIKPAFWLNQDVREDPKIWEFMQRVQFDEVIDEKLFSLPRLKDPNARPMAVEVIANKESFKGENIYLKGTWVCAKDSCQPTEFRSTDEWIIEKFSDNASRVLSSDTIHKVSKAIFDLDAFENIRDVIELISP